MRKYFKRGFMKFLMVLMILLLTSCVNYTKLKKDPIYIGTTFIVITTMVFGTVHVLVENLDKSR